jgi:hypothetical protein
MKTLASAVLFVPSLIPAPCAPMEKNRLRLGD